MTAQTEQNGFGMHSGRTADRAGTATLERAKSKMSLRIFGLSNWAAVMLFTEMANLRKEIFKEQLRKDPRVPFCLLINQSA